MIIGRSQQINHQLQLVNLRLALQIYTDKLLLPVRQQFNYGTVLLSVLTNQPPLPDPDLTVHSNTYFFPKNHFLAQCCGAEADFYNFDFLQHVTKLLRLRRKKDQLRNTALTNVTGSATLSMN